MLAIGKYKIVKRSRSGIPLELYIEEIDQDKWETSYQNSIQILTFGETNSKVPWKVYKQVPVRDFCMLVWRIHRNYILSKVCCRFNRFSRPCLY
jgi:aminopeptidase N